MGVTEATVQRWESGNIKTLRYEKIGKLAEILGVKPSVLMGWDDGEETYIDENGQKKHVVYFSGQNKNTSSTTVTIKKRLTEQEHDHIRKYRALDEHGKTHVDSVL